MKDKILLRKRSVIETINDELKNICSIEHSRHRSFENIITTMISNLIADCFFPKKPAIRYQEVKSDQLALFLNRTEVTTLIIKICYALHLVNTPQKLVTIVLLIYRYIIVLLKEAQRITQAFSLRAPVEKSIHVRAWGTLVVQLLLRYSDRA